jgi:hypothetical protein
MFGLFAAVAANAGSVLIGGSTGLSSNYITQGASAVCAAGAGNCIAGSTTGWGEKNYDNILFAGASNSGTAPVPFTGYTQTGGTSAGLTATDTANSSVNFAMISDGVNTVAGNQSNNYWQSMGTGGATDTMVVPVGVFGALDVRTMLDNQFGTLGGNDTTVTFNFGSTSNATSGLTTITVALDNVNNVSGAGAGGELRAAVSCTGGTSVCLAAGPNPKSNPVEGTVIDGVTINEGLVYNTFSYNSIPSTQPFYTGSSLVGKAKLDDQEFVFNNPALANLWLVSMTVSENVANTYASNSAAPSETALSAITVDTAPEPGTVLLLLSGLAGIGIMRVRSRSRS